MARREAVLGEMKRSFHMAAGALVMMLLTVAVLVIGQIDRSHWVSHAREVVRLAQDVRAYAVDRETGVRGYLLSRNRASLEPDRAARAPLAAAMDSLADLTVDNAEEHGLALSVREPILQWENNFANPIASAPPALAGAQSDSLAGKVLFDVFRSQEARFLALEERLYRRHIASERGVRSTAFGLLTLELIAVALLLGRFQRRLAAQTQHIIDQGDEIELQSNRVSMQNTELLQLNSDLQDQAVVLEEQQTELEVTVDELRHSEERFRMLVASMSDIVFTIDNAGRCDSLLGQWVEREKVDASLFLGRTAVEIFGEKFGEVHRAAYDRALRGDQVVYDWSTKPGPEQRFFTNALSPLRDAKGHIVGAVGVGRDVTERRRRELELETAQDRLRHAQKLEAVGQLAGGVAHDFNNVLTVITAYSDMLAMELPEADPMHESVVEIRQAANRAAALTRQLLAFSRRQELHPKPTNINEVIRGIEKLVARLLGPEHQLVVQLAPDLDAALVDAGQIEQVVMNLAANARDAMVRRGRFSLVTSRVVFDELAAQSAGLPPGAYCVISARDTGAGMSAEVRARLFEPFFTTKEAGKGTGLGLATVYGIVEQSRGYIRVDSDPGHGATFTIYIPALNKALTPRHLTSSPRAGTVLLVDDELAVRSATAKLLRESGFDVVEAGNANEALDVLRQGEARIAVLLTDMVMPGISGRELAQIVQREHPSIAVAIMSGYMRESMLQDPSSRSGIAFVEKPFTLFSLTSALREASRVAAGPH